MKGQVLFLIILIFSPSLIAIDQMEYARTQEEIVIIETDFGNIEFALFSEKAPENVANIIKLVQDGFYNGTTFHRVIPNFVIQGGDPNSKDDDPSNDGYGGPGYYTKDEISPDLKHLVGTVSLAKANPDQNGSQFYICLKKLGRLDGKYTIVGQVLEGMETVFKVAEVKTDKNDRPLKDVVMKKVYMKEKEEKAEEEKENIE